MPPCVRSRYARRVEPERPWSLDAAVAETRSEVRALRRDVEQVTVDLTLFRGETRADTVAVRGELRGEVAELRTEVRAGFGDVRTDIRRLDDRFFQMLPLQLGTLVAALASVVAAILT